jgi:hypothetical protein
MVVENSKSLATSEMLCFVDHHEDFYKRKVENIPKKSNKKLKTNEIIEKPASCHLFHWLGHRFYKMVFHFSF